MLRVIGGALKGRKIRTPEGKDVRPSSDKVRLAIFNILEGLLTFDGCCVLDVFCGTGALGLESLSRGAVRASFVESSPAVLDLARDNATRLGVRDMCQFLPFPARHLPPCPPDFPCDLVFLDPPYRQNLVFEAVEAVLEKNWVKNGGIFVIETEKEALPPPHCGRILLQRTYGITKVTFSVLES